MRGFAWNVVELCISSIAGVLILFPIQQILYHFWFHENSRKIHTRSGSQTVRPSDDHSLRLRQIARGLVTAYVFSSLITVACWYLTDLNFVTPILNSNIACRIVLGAAQNGHVICKCLLYVYFVLRSHETFSDTLFSHSAAVVITLIGLMTAGCFALISGIISRISIFLVVKKTPWGAYYCTLDNDHEVTNWQGKAAVAAFGLIDIILAIIATWLLVGKLFNFVGYTIRKRNPRIGLSAISVTIDDVEIELPDIDRKESNIRSGRLDTSRAMNKFRQTTKEHNDVLFLAVRLLILLLISVICGGLALTLSYSLKTAGALQIIEILVNVSCLWFSFSFGNKYFKKIVCGQKIMEWCFPLVKTAALTWMCCGSEGYKSYSQNVIHKPSPCFCGCGCNWICCGPQSIRDEQYLIFSMAREEFMLHIKNGDRPQSNNICSNTHTRTNTHTHTNAIEPPMQLSSALHQAIDSVGPKQ